MPNVKGEELLVPAHRRVPKGKGSLIVSSRAALVERYGEEALERVLVSCSEETERLLRGDVTPEGLYAEQAIAELVTGIYRFVGKDTFPRLVRNVARRQVETVHRLLVRSFRSPRQLSRCAHEMWEALHDTGRLEVMHGEDDRSQVITISDFTFPTAEYEKACIEYHCAMLELVGAKNVRGTSEQVRPDAYRQWYVWV